jgi:predicted aldo/keto reductase-like oxidoreductase
VTAWADKSTNAYSAIQNNSLGYPTYTAAAGANPAYVNFNPNQGLRIASRPYKTTWTLFVAMNSVTLGNRWFISPYDSVNIVLMGMNEGSNKIFGGLLPGAPGDAERGTTLK